MRKKSLVTMAATLSLTAVVMVGSTLAYLSSVTEVKTNTFTVGKVNLTLDEYTKDENGNVTVWDDHKDGKNMTPGKEVVKKPVISIAANSEPSYAYIKITGADDLISKGYTLNGFNNADWLKITPGQEIDGIYRYNGVIEKSDVDQSLSPIFTSVTYNASSEGNSDNFNGKIDVRAAAVQKDGLTQAEADNEATEKLN